MDREYGPMGLRKNFSYNEVLRAIGQQPLDLPIPKRIGLKTYEDIFFSNMINDQSSYAGDLKKQAFRMKLPTNRHKDPRFTTTRGQMLAPILLMHPMEVVGHHLLLLAEFWVRSEACVAQEQAICLYSLATTQPLSTNIRSTCHSLQMLHTTSW